jgi:hypothetical protein
MGMKRNFANRLPERKVKAEGVQLEQDVKDGGRAPARHRVAVYHAS